METTLSLKKIFTPDEPAPAAGEMKSWEGLPVPLYVDSNECDRSHVLSHLEDLPSLHHQKGAAGAAVIGVSGFQLAEQFVARGRQAKYLINIDPHPKQKVLWKIFFEAVHESANPKLAKSRIIGKVRECDLGENVLGHVLQYFSKPDHVFSTSRKWFCIKSAVEAERVLSISIDLSDRDKTTAFFLALIKCKIVIDTLYLSNLVTEQWLGKGRVAAILAEAKLTSIDGFYLTHSNFVKNCSCARSLCQRVTKIDSLTVNVPPIECLKDDTHYLDVLAKIEVLFFTLYEEVITDKQPIATYLGPRLETYKTLRDELEQYSASFKREVDGLVFALRDCQNNSSELNALLSKRFPKRYAAFIKTSYRNLYLFIVQELVRETKVIVT